MYLYSQVMPSFKLCVMFAVLYVPVQPGDAFIQAVRYVCSTICTCTARWCLRSSCALCLQYYMYLYSQVMPSFKLCVMFAVLYVPVQPGDAFVQAVRYVCSTIRTCTARWCLRSSCALCLQYYMYLYSQVMPSFKLCVMFAVLYVPVQPGDAFVQAVRYVCSTICTCTARWCLRSSCALCLQYYMYLYSQVMPSFKLCVMFAVLYVPVQPGNAFVHAVRYVCSAICTCTARWCLRSSCALCFQYYMYLYSQVMPSFKLCVMFAVLYVPVQPGDAFVQAVRYICSTICTCTARWCLRSSCALCLQYYMYLYSQVMPSFKLCVMFAVLYVPVQPGDAFVQAVRYVCSTICTCTARWCLRSSCALCLQYYMYLYSQAMPSFKLCVMFAVLYVPVQPGDAFVQAVRYVCSTICTCTARWCLRSSCALCL